MKNTINPGQGVNRAILAGLGPLLLTSMVCFAGTNIWLTPLINANSWPGTSNAPFYAGGPDAFTAILSTNKPDCTFHYAPGIYRTYGWRFELRSTANAGCKHYGSGIDKTTIQLVGAQPGCNGVIFRAAPDVFADGFEVHDMTLDCNAIHNPVFTSGSGACQAVNLGGSDVWLSGLRVIGFGTGGTNVECFPVGIGPEYPPQAPHTNVQNVIVENCTFTSPAPSNACGIGCCTVAAAPGFTYSNLVIRSCSVSNVPGNAFYCVLVENCLADNCKNGVYIEPGYQDDAHRDVMIRSNVFKNFERGIFINYGNNQRVKSVTVIGNQFQPPCSSSASFDSAWPVTVQTSGLGWLVLSSNTVYDANCSGVPNSAFWLARIDRAVVQGNRISLASGRGLNVDCATVPTRWFLGNVDGANAPLLVSTNDLGIATSPQAEATLWQQVKPPQVAVRLLSGP